MRKSFYLQLVVLVCLSLSHFSAFGQEACLKYFGGSEKDLFIPISSPARLLNFGPAKSNLALRRLTRGFLAGPSSVAKPKAYVPNLLAEVKIPQTQEAPTRRAVLPFQSENYSDIIPLIESKIAKGETLSREDILVIYELYIPFEGNIYKARERLKAIIKNRNIREDIALAFDIKPSEVSLTREEALRGGIKVHYGDLDMANVWLKPSERLPNGMVEMPELVIGNFKFHFAANQLDGIHFDHYKWPLMVHGNYTFYGRMTGFWSAPNWIIPQVTGTAYLYGLETLNGTIGVRDNFPGDLYVSEAYWKVKVPDDFPGSLTYFAAEMIHGHQFPIRVGGNLTIRTTRMGAIVLPQYVGGSLLLDFPINLNYVTLPDYIGGTLYLPRSLMRFQNRISNNLQDYLHQLQWID